MLMKNKRNGKIAEVKELENGMFEVKYEDGKVKENDSKTIKRWWEEVKVKEVEEVEVEEVKVVEEKKEEKKEEIKYPAKHEPQTEKFAQKLDAFKVKEIRVRHIKKGVAKSALAKEYGVSFRTITCIVEYLMWRNDGLINDPIEKDLLEEGAKIREKEKEIRRKKAEKKAS